MIWLFAYVRYRPDREFDSLCFLPGLVLKYFCLSREGGGGTPYNGLYGEVYEKVAGILLVNWSIRKGREICHLGLWKGPKGSQVNFMVL